MGDHEHAAVGGPQIILEPGDGRDVEMVSGFVEKQKPRIFDKYLRERDFFDHTARKGSHHERKIRYTECRKYRPY